MNENKALEQKVLAWLEGQGYPLEMRVASKLRAAKMPIRHGWHYEDPETNTSREIDIICTAGHPLGLAEIHFAIECKGTKKPWILFTSEDACENYNRFLTFGVLSSESHKALVTKVFSHPSDKNEQFEVAKDIPWLWKEGRVGYSLTQAFEGSKDTPYAGALSAVKASLWLQSNSPQQSAKYRPFVVAFPIVITSSPLFECFLDDSGNTKLERITSGFLFFQQHLPEFVGTCVNVVSEDGIDVFLQESQQVVSKIFSYLESDIQMAWEEFKKHVSGKGT